VIALLFAGHGTEHPGMGADLIADDTELIALASTLGAFDGAKLLRRGGPALHRTRVVQPLLTAVNLTILARLVEHGLHWQLCLGHSLGELAAWSATGAITAVQAVTLAAKRGAIVTELARAHPGGMLALQLDEGDLDEALALGRTCGIVDIAVHNGPGQWALSGERSALAAIAGRFGGNFVGTDGAWHSRLMAAAVEPFRAAVEAVHAQARPRTTGIIANHDGRLCRPADDFVAPFVAQMTGTVHWAACMDTLADLDVREAVIVGPGKLLAGLLRANLAARIDAGQLRIHRVEDRRDLDRVIEVLG
jgi:[acyl-carrier-protein] S-malonyltransferase